MIWLRANSRWLFFFFSSRRRHTRLVSDWSSDVCSSDLSLERVCEKIRWVCEARDAAGRGADAVELEMNQWLAKVTPSAAAASDLLERMASRHGVDVELIAASPAVLVGTAAQIVDTLQRRRESLGVSTVQLDA